jgi:hypothetical protein
MKKPREPITIESRGPVKRFPGGVLQQQRLPIECVVAWAYGSRKGWSLRRIEAVATLVAERGHMALPNGLSVLNAARDVLDMSVQNRSVFKILDQHGEPISISADAQLLPVSPKEWNEPHTFHTFAIYPKGLLTCSANSRILGVQCLQREVREAWPVINSNPPTTRSTAVKDVRKRVTPNHLKISQAIKLEFGEGRVPEILRAGERNARLWSRMKGDPMNLLETELPRERQMRDYFKKAAKSGKTG